MSKSIPAGVSPGAPAALKAANHALVLRALGQGGEMTQAAIARDTGLSAATVSNIISTLQADGSVAIRKGVIGGKSANLVSASRVGGVVISVYARWTAQSHAGIITAAAAKAEAAGPETVGTVVEAYDPSQSLGESALRLVRRLVGELGDPPLRSLVVGLPGRTDIHREASLVRSFVEQDMRVPTASDLRDALGVPVQLENVVNLAALAELRWGVAQGLQHVVYVDASTTIGAALVFNGQVYRGAYGTAGRFGHVTVDPAGILCVCGSRGCLVTVAGEDALLRLTRNDPRGGGPVNLVELVTRAREGDPLSMRAVHEAGRSMGGASADLGTLLGPEMVVVGGYLTEADDIYFAPFRTAFDERFPAQKQRGGSTSVAVAKFRLDGPLLGGLAMARDQVELRA